MTISPSYIFNQTVNEKLLSQTLIDDTVAQFLQFLAADGELHIDVLPFFDLIRKPFHQFLEFLRILFDQLGYFDRKQFSIIIMLILYSTKADKTYSDHVIFFNNRGPKDESIRNGQRELVYNVFRRFL